MKFWVQIINASIIFYVLEKKYRIYRIWEDRSILHINVGSYMESYILHICHTVFCILAGYAYALYSLHVCQMLWWTSKALLLATEVIGSTVIHAWTFPVTNFLFSTLVLYMQCSCTVFQDFGPHYKWTSLGWGLNLIYKFRFGDEGYF